MTAQRNKGVWMCVWGEEGRGLKQTAQTPLFAHLTTLYFRASASPKRRSASASCPVPLLFCLLERASRTGRAGQRLHVYITQLFAKATLQLHGMAWHGMVRSDHVLVLLLGVWPPYGLPPRNRRHPRHHHCVILPPVNKVDRQLVSWGTDNKKVRFKVVRNRQVG